MGSFSKGLPVFLLVFLVTLNTGIAGNFNQEFEVTWGGHRGKVFNGGELLSLSLDKTSGSGFQSKKEYLFGRIDMQLKLVAGDSAGTVTTYYLSSQGPNHNEIDFEFLGNVTGEPYIVHTNVYAQAKGNREQQFYLWFDPTKNFHTYSIQWNPYQIVQAHYSTISFATCKFLVDNTPMAIRQFKNAESLGVSYPKNQPMRIYSSLWNADDWATRGGLVKTDWSKAPFTAYYRNFNVQTCSGSCTSGFSNRAWQNQELDAYSRRRLRWVQKNFLIYNYCTDYKRFPRGFPPECRV